MRLSLVSCYIFIQEYSTKLWIIFRAENMTFGLCIQDVTHKVVEAIGTIAGSSLEQTTWLRRNLEVKASPQIVVDGANLEADVEGVLLTNTHCSTVM